MAANASKEQENTESFAKDGASNSDNTDDAGIGAGTLGKLHWAHWLVVSLSLVLTLSAWYFTKKQTEERVAARFEREADRVIELVKERMQKYEDGLWGGVSAIQAMGGDTDYKNWLKFANSFRIDVKYPGINGIGVIHHVPKKQLGSYLRKHRRERPDYTIFPKHNEKEYLPITFVEPYAANAKAVGLDMAHEQNRYTAAKQARDTGEAQITGPIVLVQDSAKTPGFLFYAPFYKGGPKGTVQGRRDNFIGMVYAPFITSKLIAGSLQKEKRLVGLSISDGQQTIYDEHDTNEASYDPNPLFVREVTVPMYGREWSYKIRSTMAFRQAATYAQSTIILIGGLFIDGLLLSLFIILSRTNQHAIAFAERKNREADEHRMKSANASKMAALGEMAAGIAHEINNPLTIMSGYIDRLQRDIEAETPDKKRMLDICTKSRNAIQRISGIINGLCNFSRDTSNDVFTVEPMTEIITATMDFCRERVKNKGIEMKLEIDAGISLRCKKIPLSQVLINLVNNSVAAIKDQENPWIKISARSERMDVVISVADSGQGIAAELYEKIFQPFFTTKDVGEGTGLGLSVSSGLIKKMNGEMTLDRTAANTTFVIRLFEAIVETAPPSEKTEASDSKDASTKSNSGKKAA